MLKKPGTHWVSTTGSPFYAKVEVEPDGTCHQLTLEGERDGILSPDKWETNAIVVEDLT